MIKLLPLLASAAVLGALTAATPPPAPDPRAAKSAPAKPTPAVRPNVVVLFVDDMGFSDIGSYGGEIPTPNLDKLAAGGLRFTQFYNTARCSPSRASLLTGLYPHQAGMGHLDNVVRPESQGLRGRLLPRAVTMAQVLSGAGYFTGMTGKWNLGTQNGSPPWEHGFARSLETRGGTYFPNQPGHDWAYIDGKRVASGDPAVGTGNWYASDLFVDWQKRFLAEAKAERKPFFLYLPFTAPHFPMMAPPEDIARFKGRYQAGWNELRRQRYERQKELGIIPAAEPLPPPLSQAYDWKTLTPTQRDRFDTMMAVYAASIVRMDKAVGDLVAALRSSGDLENTLILFLSDNGGNAEGGPNGRAQGSPLGSVDSNIFVGLNWATLQNTPFQYFKHYTEEGGIATPMIAYWPAGIDRGLNGKFVRDPGHLIDVMPTVLQIAGATYPTQFKGEAILAMEGRSFAPAFRGAALNRSVPIFWEHEGNRAVRDGSWKLVARLGEPWQLFDMTADRSETRDLAIADPARVARMSAQWDAWAKRSFVDAWTRKEPGGVVEQTPGAGPRRDGAAGQREGGRRRRGGPGARTGAEADVD